MQRCRNQNWSRSHISGGSRKENGNWIFLAFPWNKSSIELPEAEQVCLECGGKLHACGHEVLRRELAYVPAQYKVVEHVQTAYACRCCERNSDHVFLRKSEVPAPLIPGSGVASPSLLAHIMNSKYTLALPLYRQEQELQRRGLSISRQTMSNWIIYAYQHYFPSLFHALHQELLKSEILHADETTLTVLREDGRQARQKSYVWVYRTSGDAVSPVVLYDYQPSRSGVCASNFLQGFTGLLHTDGYEAYHCKLPQEITSCGLLGTYEAKIHGYIENASEGYPGTLSSSSRSGVLQ